MWSAFVKFTTKYPIIRGMISYSILWPCGSIAEQTLVEKRNFRTYDWNKCLRYSIFGAFFAGPAIYMWIRLAGIMWPRTDIKSSLCKAYTEQLAYDPFAIGAFLFGMTLMEGRTVEEGRKEVSSKFWNTYKIGFIYWPCVQTINFAFIPQRNQAVFTSFFSMCWTTFLAYVKQLELPNVDVEEHFIYATDIHLLET